MARKSSWTQVSFENGVATFDILSWKYFRDFIYKELPNHTNIIYRGHRCENWKLESTLERLLQKGSRSVSKSRVDEHLKSFGYAVRGRRGANPPKLGSDDMWALGQHHGLATPLLDWTVSPYVAAYFAFCNSRDDDTGKRVVFALAKNMIEDKCKEIEKKYSGKGKPQLGKLPPRMPPLIEFFKPDSHENPRLVNQAGSFTRAPIGVDIETWVKTNFKDESGCWILAKLRIPSADRESCLKELNRMNINHLTLFPDIYGVSIFCNMNAEIPNYSE